MNQSLVIFLAVTSEKVCYGCLKKCDHEKIGILMKYF